jgi:diguanylate cyclase (GGDEF)-like protein
MGMRVTNVVGLTLIIAVTNICLGFALAVALGYGPPGLVNSLGTFRLSPSRLPFRLPWRIPFHIPFHIQIHFHKKVPPPVEEPVEDQPIAGLEEMLETSECGEMHFEPFNDPYDDDAGELLHPDMPDAWNLNEKFVETSVLKLNIAMMKSGMRATEIDTKLRACRGHSDAETIETCLRLLREDCISYLAEQSETAKKFGARLGELGELKSLGQEIEMDNLEQSAQVETTLNNLEFMDFSGDPEAGNYRLLEEVKNLRMARHRLHDKQESAFLAIARFENRIDKIEKQICDDPQTKLLNRIGVELELYKWWQQKLHKKRPMSMALFDIDRFGLVNEQHGPLIGDRVLFQFGQLLKSAVGKSDLVGRYAGQQFLVVMLDVGPRAALKTFEVMRQTVEKTTFMYDLGKINITTGEAITEVAPGESYAGVLDRLEKSIKSVKEAGVNQAVLHNGRVIEPIDSPSFGVEETRLQI